MSYDVFALRGAPLPSPVPSLEHGSSALARPRDAVSVDSRFEGGVRLVEALAVTAGERVLDVGCGTGLLAAYMARLVGPRGFVLGIDPMPRRIEVAREHRRMEALPWADFRVGSASGLSDVGAETFDVVCLNAVFHWLPDKAVALRQFFRVLCPGGRIGIAGSTRDQVSAMRLAIGGVLARPPFAAHRRERPLIWRVDDQEMRGLLAAAGFETVRIAIHDAPQLLPSAEAVARFAEASSFGDLLGHLPADLRAQARKAIVAALAPLALADGSIVSEGHRMIAVATRPARR